ncbi:MAG: 4Fe-4S binding protein [Candidatus Thermoplasmatota archaeon]|nr:4Fe-4S binding protein [Candidatus Thermoplasmatota archaeon]MBS3789513.1 4Fe-4S binding protein [Candidatus Thermoplasmatota archaeon]
MSEYKSTGIIRKEDLEIPSDERLEEGPVVIMECVENIPCDPCVAACSFDAVEMEEITDTPDVEYETCTGCGFCVTECPGLAIFVVDCSYSDENCKITIPYEYIPVPDEGDEVKALDREGNEVQKAVVTNVRQSGKTYAVTIEVDKENVWKVRGFEVEK